MNPSCRSIDHPQLSVNDVDGAIADFERLGFVPTPRMYHSFGTSNALLVFEQDYLELLGDFERITDPAVRETFRELEHREGFGKLAVFSADIESDRKNFIAAGGNPIEIRTFSRVVTTDDGDEATVSFSIFGESRPDFPQLLLFACQQHNPEHLWKPVFQKHANTAQSIDSVTYVARDPSMHREYLEIYFGKGVTEAVGDGLSLTTRRGARIEIITPRDMRSRYGEMADRFGDGDHGVAIRLKVANLQVARSILSANRITHSVVDDSILRIHPDAARGVIMEFTS